uniref:RING-type E3 ubiquitin transferase n=1 Tax=Panagrellus redivivus TaxID=6233 RepID=A0A7E4VIX6_PANRE
MAPLGQGQNWSEVLCCPVCSELYGLTQVPINLACGHAVCSSCIKKRSEMCPHDGSQIPSDAITYPVNRALLSILNIHHKDLLCSPPTPNYIELTNVAPLATANQHLLTLAQYLRLADSERGGAVYSDLVSRTTQRRLLAVLFAPIYFPDGRISAMRAIRSLCDRIVTELICLVQNTVHMSAFLWSAVRARGCQFLGPAMQEDVLRLILLTLANGELIARKTLVMYIVQTLSEDYPHVSKTCVGHVVQLLYRASCFNVIKRDGESSLMQLKEEFREYESLRREHDSQIVQIALEAGLRISPDQWSALLYGDPHHRSHMQSIVDRLHSPQLLSNAIKELQSLAERNTHPVSFQKLTDHLAVIAEMDHDSDSQWQRLNETLTALETVVYEYVAFTKRHMNMNDYRKKTGVPSRTVKQADPQPPGFQNNGLSFCRYKTKMCRDVVAGRQCPRRAACTYAHIVEELRPVESADPRANGLQKTESNGMLQNGNNNNQQMRQPGMMMPDHSPSLPQGPDMMSIPMMSVHAMGDGMMESQSLMIDNGNGIVNVVPVVMHTQIPDHDGYPKRAPTAIPAPIGMPGPIFMMPSGEHIPSAMPIPNAHLPMVQTNGAGVAGSAGMYSYQIQPNPAPFMAHQSTMIFPQHNMWASGQVYQKSPEVPIYMEQPRQGMPPNHPASDSSRRNSTNGSASSSLNDQKSKWHAQEGSLMIRRNEVIQRLRSFQTSKDESEPEDAERSDHVSFTVANSVLFDDMDSFNAKILDFPPLPIQTLATVQTTVSQSVISDALSAVTSTSWSLMDSKKINNALSVRTVCPTTLMRADSSKPATVQADCTVMNVRDAIEQPLVTATLQLNNLLVEPQASYEMVDPVQLTDLLPRVMKSVAPPQDPQDFVSDSLDKIVTVQERINEVPSSTSSAVEKEQLKVELNIANRQLSALDLQTKQTCLLNELKAIDERIENLGANPDP